MKRVENVKIFCQDLYYPQLWVKITSVKLANVTLEKRKRQTLRLQS